MNDGPLKVLLIEDDEEDYLLTADALFDVQSAVYEVTWVSEVDKAVKMLLAGKHDVCLLDYRLGPRTGLEILEEARSAGCWMPVIMLTGADDPKVDRAAMAAGAADYFVKDRLEPRCIERSIRYAIKHTQSERALKRCSEALSNTHEKLREMHEELARKDLEISRLKEELSRFVRVAARQPLASTGPSGEK